MAQQMMALLGREGEKRQTAGWTPATPTNLWGWWDASNAGSITSAATLVSQWNDLSGNARHLVQATGANKPITGTRTINSKNALDFTPVQFMTVASITLAQPVSVFIVMQSDLADGVLHWGFGRVSSTPGIGISTGNAWQSSAGSSVTYGTADATKPHVFGALFNGASSSFSVDGAILSSGNPSTTGWSAQNFRIGGGGSSNDWNGMIAEVIVYDRALTKLERRTARRFLGAKWGVHIP